ncbi:DUF5123 domain-containing protein [Flavobacterium sp. MAHUQ-51]|uniref:DUF5123 domain-containing protein n=1 Tax=Flavobacterium sp. GCM10022190 TaxID=3252639 RepID=UPI0036130257
MKAKFIIKTFLVSLLMVGTLLSCTGYNEDIINELEVDRAFAPVQLTATVRTQTTVELNWTARENVDHYVVEFSADDPNFTTIAKTLTVEASELPIKVQMEGETLYSIRVKAIVNGIAESNWTTVTAKTLSEQIFSNIINGDILSYEATLRWPAGSNVTQIKLMPGNITHVITAQEKANGVAKITGLSAETAYTATLYNGTKVRGTKTFTTGVDLTNAIIVKPTDNLIQKITDAPSGALLVLEPGDYTAQTGTITLAKSIKIQGLKSYDKPLLKLNFLLVAGSANVSLIDLDLSGGGTMTDLLRINEASNNYGAIGYRGCTIHDFTRSLVAANIAAKITSFTIENSVVKNVNTAAGGDFIDFRLSYIADIMIKNNTFVNCSSDRDFVRVDATTNFTGNTNVTLDSNTLYKTSNSSTTTFRRIFYVRFATHTLVSKNNIFDSTNALYANQSTTNNPTFTNNNYTNATNLTAVAVAPIRYDASGTSLDPGFASAATDDFTIANQTLKDRKVGDPRWIKN